MLPLFVPTLIFGIEAVRSASLDSAAFLPSFLILCAISLASLVPGPARSRRRIAVPAAVMRTPLSLMRCAICGITPDGSNTSRTVCADGSSMAAPDP